MNKMVGQERMNAEATAQPMPPWWMRLLIGRRPKRTMVRLVILASLSFIVFKWMLLPVRIQGVSMEPNYHDGRINFVNRLSYLWGAPRRGDVVAIRMAGVHVMFLKRLVGLPGERIAIRNGIILINGRPLAEPYVIRPRAPWEEEEIQLSPRQYFYVGDNRDMPAEAHRHDVVDVDRLVGKVLF